MDEFRKQATKEVGKAGRAIGLISQAISMLDEIRPLRVSNHRNAGGRDADLMLA